VTTDRPGGDGYQSPDELLARSVSIDCLRLPDDL